MSLTSADWISIFPGLCLFAAGIIAVAVDLLMQEKSSRAPLAVVCMTGIIGAFQVFASAYIISNGTGGPAGMTNFITLYLYKRGFSDGQYGYAAAIAWVLLVVVAIIAVILFRTQKNWVHYSGDNQ